jgi:hypothetical protein
MKAPSAQRPAINRVEQKGRISPHRLVDALDLVGVTVNIHRDAVGKLQYRMLPEAQAYFMPVLKHYKQEILCELNGEPAYTKETCERFMALPLVKCFSCQNYVQGQQMRGRYQPGRCAVRDMLISRPAKGIRCLWYLGLEES